MKKEERQERILHMIEVSGNVTVSEIMEALSVSDMTVRRDLSEMAQKGLLIRNHGGAQRALSPEGIYERSHIEKRSLKEDEKNRIAAAAAALINDGETVFIGPGTSLEKLADQLRGRAVRVVTNSLPVFEILCRDTDVDLILTGGEFRAVTGAFVGSSAVRVLENMRFSRAFISANGISADAVYTYSEAEGEIQKLALNCAKEKILTADSSKFGQYDFYEFYRLEDFDRIITDDGIGSDVSEALRARSEVVIAS